MKSIIFKYQLALEFYFRILFVPTFLRVKDFQVVNRTLTMEQLYLFEWLFFSVMIYRKWEDDKVEQPMMKSSRHYEATDQEVD